MKNTDYIVVQCLRPFEGRYVLDREVTVKTEEVSFWRAFSRWRSPMMKQLAEKGYRLQPMRYAKYAEKGEVK